MMHSYIRQMDNFHQSLEVNCADKKIPPSIIKLPKTTVLLKKI